MGKSFWKNFFREIRGNKGRFLSILFIVMLGVSFFAGVRATEPDMRASMDAFVRAQDYMDIRVLSTLGLSKDDVAAIRDIDGVTRAEGGYDLHVLSTHEDTTEVLEIMSIADDMNDLILDSGRLPEAKNECVADRKLAEAWGLKAGDRIKVFFGNDAKLKDNLKVDTFTVTGIGRYPGYLTEDRDSSSIGNGTVSGFLAVSKKAFAMDAYTVVFARTDGLSKYSTYDAEYKRGVSDIQKRIEAIADERLDIRMSELTKKLRDGEKEIEDGRTELADGKSELADGEAKLEDAKQELADGRETLKKKKKQTYDKLDDSQDKIDAGQKQIDAALKEYAKNKKLIESGLAQIDEAEAQIDAAIAAAGAAGNSDGTAGDSAGSGNVDGSAGDAGGMIDPAAAKAELEAKRAELESQMAQLEAGHQQILAQQKKLDASQKQLDAGYDKADQSFDKAEDQLDQGAATIAENESKIEENKIKLRDAERDLEKAEREIADGWQDIRDLGAGKWYVLDRQDNRSFAEYDSNAERIGAIGKVFPLFFFLIAALISLTTMTRMVEEQRSQIGLMEALGYSKGVILWKFVGYCLLATVTGSVLGVLMGEKLFPFVIIYAYGGQFVNMNQMVIPYEWKFSLMAAGGAILCNLLATIWACWNLMRSNPAELMRPEAPKAGNKILLEKIPFIWKRLKFSRKASFRNIFRYKKRLLMTIIGIGGCTGMLLTGFGINDAVMTMSNEQYKTIWNYDIQLDVDTDASAADLRSLTTAIGDTDKYSEYLKAADDSITVGRTSDAETDYYDAKLIVPMDRERISDFFGLHDRVSKKKYELDDDTIIITEKLAKLLNARVGSTVTIKLDDDNFVDAEVGHITENYLLHYIYMSPELYEKLAHEKAPLDTIFVQYAGETPANETAYTEALLEEDAVSQLTLASEASRSMDNMTSLMGLVIAILTAAAGLLAFIVIFNLNNISITERRRELATLKVLGFFDEEVAMYVYRENIILTGLSIIAGLIAGTFMEKFIMQTAEIDSLMFGKNIEPASYLISILLTILFALIVNGISYFSLKKIDMIESLKSVE